MVDKSDNTASQQQASTQSGKQGEHLTKTGKPSIKTHAPSGIGASQGQDSSASAPPQGQRPSAGTADIERGGPQDHSRAGNTSTESLVNDPTGAFKERP